MEYVNTRLFLIINIDRADTWYKIISEIYEYKSHYAADSLRISAQQSVNCLLNKMSGFIAFKCIIYYEVRNYR